MKGINNDNNKDKKRSVMGSISIAYLHPHIEWLESLHINCDSWLNKHKISRQDLINQHKHVPILVMLERLNELKILAQDPAMGFKVGIHANPRNWGIITPLLMNSPTLGQALMYALDYEHLFNSAITTTLTMDDEWVTCTLNSKDLPVDGIASMIEQDLASTTNIIRFLLDKKHQLLPWIKQVNFLHAPPPDTSIYEEYFIAPVTFNANSNSLIFSREAMNLPIKFADANVLKSTLIQIEEIAQQAENQSIEKHLTSFIVESLPTGLPNIHHAAEHIGISASTLKRRLLEENTNYKSLCSKIRKRQSQNLLQDLDNSLMDVALKLGYTDQPAFYRAFRDWHQCTPKVYREQLFG